MGSSQSLQGVTVGSLNPVKSSGHTHRQLFGVYSVYSVRGLNCQHCGEFKLCTIEIWSDSKAVLGRAVGRFRLTIVRGLARLRTNLVEIFGEPGELAKTMQNQLFIHS